MKSGSKAGPSSRKGPGGGSKAGGGGAKAAPKGPAGWPSRTGNPSGDGRTNAPSKK